MFRTAWRSVCAHKARLAMTVLAVALGTAFVCATLVLTATVSADVTRAYRAGPGGPDVVVRSDDTAGPPSRGEPALPRGTLERLRRLPEAAAVTGVATGYTAIGCPDGRPAGDGAASVGTGWTRLGPAPAAHPGPRRTAPARGARTRRVSVAGFRPPRRVGVIREPWAGTRGGGADPGAVVGTGP